MHDASGRKLEYESLRSLARWTKDNGGTHGTLATTSGSTGWSSARSDTSRTTARPRSPPSPTRNRRHDLGRRTPAGGPSPRASSTRRSAASSTGSSGEECGSPARGPTRAAAGNAGSPTAESHARCRESRRSFNHSDADLARRLRDDWADHITHTSDGTGYAHDAPTVAGARVGRWGGWFSRGLGAPRCVRRGLLRRRRARWCERRRTRSSLWWRCSRAAV